MPHSPFVRDRQSALDATQLIADHGDLAHAAARAAAASSRDLGNVVLYCRWRQIARLIDALDDVGGLATRH